MPKVGFSLTPIPSVVTPLIAVLYNTAAIGVEVDRIVDATDHSSPQNFLFPNLDPGTYIVIIYTSVDGETLNNLIIDFFQDAKDDGSTQELRFYVVDGPDDIDPVAGTNKISDPYFIGKDVSGLFQAGNRELKKATEWFINSDGDIEYLTDMVGGTPYLNYTQSVWVVTITIAQVANSTSGQTFGDAIEITADTLFISTMYNKDIYAKAAGTTIKLTLNALATYTQQKGFRLVHDGGNAPNLVLQLAPGDIARFMGDDYNQIILGIGEGIDCLIKTISGSPKLYTKPINGQWDRVGEVLAWDAEDKVNTLPLNNPVTEYDLTVYLRLKWLLDELPLTSKTTYALFDTSTVLPGNDLSIYEYRGLFAVSDDGLMCRLPDYRNQSIRFLKPGDNERYPDNRAGGVQDDGIRTFEANAVLGPSLRSNSDSGANKVAVGGDAPEGANILIPVFYTGANDTRPKNVGKIPLLLI